MKKALIGALIILLLGAGLCMYSLKFVLTAQNIPVERILLLKELID